MSKSVFAGKSVLVTGAGGSIGSELCRLIMSDNAKSLTMVSLTEAGLYTINRSLEKDFRKYRDTQLVPVLGSAGDAIMMGRHLAGVDVVVHAAAHKHLPLCEINPLIAIENNVINTWRLIEAAQQARVGQFVLVSSDKAVNPASIMGATKRLAELIVANYPFGPTRYFTVRFGNVLDSAGSVLPLWREQAQAGGPITITDERCERFFMSIPEAVALIAETIALDPDQGTFVLDMGAPRKMVDVARELLEKMGLAKKVKIETIGLRPGEKITEELHYGGDVEKTAANKVLFVREPARERLDPMLLRELAAYVTERDTDAAVELLWNLVQP